MKLRPLFVAALVVCTFAEASAANENDIENNVETYAVAEDTLEVRYDVITGNNLNDIRNITQYLAKYCGDYGTGYLRGSWLGNAGGLVGSKVPTGWAYYIVYDYKYAENARRVIEGIYQICIENSVRWGVSVSYTVRSRTE